MKWIVILIFIVGQIHVDLVLIEARYQRAVFQGSEEVLKRDFQLRYGDKWQSIWEASDNASEEDIKKAEELAEGLAELVSARIDDLETAALYAKYGRNLTLEPQVKLGMELLGKAEALEKMLRWGLVMHFSDEVISAPPYLAKLLLKLIQHDVKLDVDLWEELERYSRDYSSMAFLEGLLTGDFDEELHKALYGAPASQLKIGRATVYTSDVGLVVNPAYSPEELLGVLLQIKKRRADMLARALSLHGEYEFSEEYRCGSQYISLDGSAEKSGVIAICPWLSYSRRLWRRARNLILIVEGSRPPQLRQFKYGVIFIRGGEAEVIKPYTPSKIFEYIIDVLYGAGFYVLEGEESSAF
ncbi:hypothetical protein [Pyrobaculum aerophilum]|nr:hypothetical protein [Pyrobaculum aerophilum]